MFLCFTPVFVEVQQLCLQFIPLEAWPLIQIHLIPNSKIHGANMEPIWGRQDPGGPHVGPMSLVIWDDSLSYPYARERQWRESVVDVFILA